MSIPDLLWGVLKRKGYRTIAEMARGEGVPQATMYSWMTLRPEHRRKPYSPSSLMTIERITGVPLADLIRISAAMEGSH